MELLGLNESFQELDDSYLLTLHIPKFAHEKLEVSVEGTTLKVHVQVPEGTKVESSFAKRALNRVLGPDEAVDPGSIRTFTTKWKLDQSKISCVQEGAFFFIRIKKKVW